MPCVDCCRVQRRRWSRPRRPRRCLPRAGPRWARGADDSFLAAADGDEASARSRDRHRSLTGLAGELEEAGWCQPREGGGGCIVCVRRRRGRRRPGDGRSSPSRRDSGRGCRAARDGRARTTITAATPGLPSMKARCELVSSSRSVAGAPPRSSRRSPVGHRLAARAPRLTATSTPAARRISAVSAVVVVLPAVPVMPMVLPATVPAGASPRQETRVPCARSLATRSGRLGRPRVEVGDVGDSRIGVEIGPTARRRRRECATESASGGALPRASETDAGPSRKGAGAQARSRPGRSPR